MKTLLQALKAAVEQVEFVDMDNWVKQHNDGRTSYCIGGAYLVSKGYQPVFNSLTTAWSFITPQGEKLDVIIAFYLAAGLNYPEYSAHHIVFVQDWLDEDYIYALNDAQNEGRDQKAVVLDYLDYLISEAA